MPKMFQGCSSLLHYPTALLPGCLFILASRCRIESIEPADEGEPERYRTAVLAVPHSTPFTAIPCGVCPVMDQCCEGSQISPQTCVYYQTWLDF